MQVGLGLPKDTIANPAVRRVAKYLLQADCVCQDVHFDLQGLRQEALHGC